MNELLSKQGQSVTQLAQLLLQAQVSDRLPSMQQIASEQGMSVGTVQAAMQYLQTEGVANVENRGRLGAFVREIDYVRLWSLAYRQNMIGLLPMPYSRQIEGLATGLRDACDAVDFAVDMRFVRGSMERIERLHARQCDWTIASLYALDYAHIQGFEAEVLLSFGANSYNR